MKLKELNYYYNKMKFGEDNFHDLMNFRIKKILLISTFTTPTSLNMTPNFQTR